MPAIPKDVYPLSTARSEAIPYEVGSPLAMFHVNAIMGASTPLALPADANLCSVYFKDDTYIFTGAPVDPVYFNMLAEGAYFCKGGMIAELYLPKDIWVRGTKDTTGYINILTPWVQMNNTSKYGVS